jgi:hypothetical protein
MPADDDAPQPEWVEPDLPPAPSGEVVDRKGRYVLVGRERTYAVYRADSMDAPVLEFPDDDTGFEAAVDAMERIARRERLERLSGWLLPVLIVSTAAWVVFGAILTWLVVFPGSEPVFGGPGERTPYKVMSLLEQVAFRVAVASFIAIAGLWMTRERAGRPRARTGQLEG